MRATEAAKESFAKLEAMAVSGSPIGNSLAAWFLRYRNSLMYLYGSRPFISSQGYIGLCPGTAAHEDTIFIPGGSHCPYVIRRASSLPTTTGPSVLSA